MATHSHPEFQFQGPQGPLLCPWWAPSMHVVHIHTYVQANTHTQKINKNRRYPYLTLMKTVQKETKSSLVWTQQKTPRAAVHFSSVTLRKQGWPRGTCARTTGQPDPDAWRTLWGYFHHVSQRAFIARLNSWEKRSGCCRLHVSTCSCPTTEEKLATAHEEGQGEGRGSHDIFFF